VKPYSKIETLFDRDEDFRVDVSKLRRPVFGTIAGWLVTEKVDGTNIRIGFSRIKDGTTYTVAGKTDEASIPPKLLAHCSDLAGRVAPEVLAIMREHDLDALTLYGEGYGAKIQSGGRYRPDQGFTLFDVAVADGTYLSDGAVTETAEKLGIPRVPLLNGGEPMALAEIVALVRDGFASGAAQEFDPEFMAEGIVARTVEPLYDNRGERLIFKLKGKDFRAQGRRSGRPREQVGAS
jgi:hypothetical protein